MRKLFAMLLALALGLSAAGAPAEESAETPLPQAGDVVEGFEVKEIRPFDMIGAQLVLFEHQRTGAKLVYIANDDTNRVFDLTFLTDAVDNTGLPHVFEHSTLDGSAKYPSKALFFNLSYQTYNTYMNAMTSDRMTTYPVASLSEKQLLKLADYYTDSCLNPMIMEDESIYREEAWRYRLESEDAPLTIEGTVYSEMLGATTLERTANLNMRRAAFPGSLIGNDQGGTPDAIPNMTYESLRDYHNLYYHPSNCVAYLYGRFQDYRAFLALLDQAFAPFERREFTREDSGYTPITEPAVEKAEYPIEKGGSTDNASTVYYTFVVRGADQQQELELNTLTDLLGADASSMKQALKAALPSGTFSCYLELAGPEPAVVFTANNVPDDAAETFKATVDAELAKVAEAGFPQDLVDGVMASVSISARLARENADVGVNVISSLAYSYAYSGNPWNYPEYVDALSQMDQWNRDGRYAEVTRTFLTGSQTTALVTTSPKPGLKEEKDAALAEKLAQVKAGMSPEEISALIAASARGEEEDDASAMVAALQAETVSSLPEEMKEYPISDQTADGTRYIDVTAGVDGVGQANIFLSADDLPQEDLLWFKLYTQLLGEVDTAAHTKAELASLSTRYLYSRNIRLSLTGRLSDYHKYLRLGWIAEDGDLAAGYDLMYEMVFDSRFDQPDQLLAAVQKIRTDLKASIQGAPYNMMLYSALSRGSELVACYDYTTGLSYYAFLEEVEKELTSGDTDPGEKLAGIQARLKNRDGAVSLYAGSEEGIAANRALAEAFLAKLPAETREKQTYSFENVPDSEALVLDSKVQYNLVAADYAALGMEGYDAGLDAVTQLVNDMYLYPQLRDQYGAYGVLHGTLTEEGVYIVSYRDPNVTETFAVYDQLPEKIASLEVEQSALDGYILSAYSALARPDGELSGAAAAGLDVLQGFDPARKLTWMAELKQVTPEKIRQSADMYKALMEKGVRMTAGGAGVIEAHKDLYKEILNPFGVVDAGEMTFTDAGEDSPYHEAVAFVMENGFMTPAAEDRFGVEDAATNADIAAAIGALAFGQKMTAEEALANLSTYGILPADLDLTAELTDTGMMQMVSGLMTAVGQTMETPETTGAAMTRGEVAQALMELFNED